MMNDFPERSFRPPSQLFIFEIHVSFAQSAFGVYTIRTICNLRTNQVPTIFVLQPSSQLSARHSDRLSSVHRRWPNRFAQHPLRWRAVPWTSSSQWPIRWPFVCRAARSATTRPVSVPLSCANSTVFTRQPRASQHTHTPTRAHKKRNNKIK